MIPIVGSIGVGLLIWTLFRLDRSSFNGTKALWMPYAWLLIASSRPISNWLSLSAPVGQATAYVDGSPLDRAVLTLLLGIGIIALIKRKKQAIAILADNRIVLVYFGYCLISVLWCDYPSVLLKRWIRSVGDLVVILLIMTEPNWVDALKWLFTRIGFVLIPLSILLIRFFPSLGRFYSRGGAPEWTGVGTDKNALGMVCMIYGAALLWYAIGVYRRRSDKGRGQKLLALSVAFVMIVYLVLVVDSKTAFACFFMSDVLIIVTAISRAFRKPFLVTVLVAGMIGVCFSVLFLGVGGGALTALGRDASLTGRTDVWKTVLPYAKSEWLGAGYENFWVGERMELFGRLLGGLNQAHNGYIEIYLNLGWAGVILLAAIIVSGYQKILKGLGSNTETAGLRLALFFICLVYNLTEATFKMQSPVWIFFLWAIMAPYSRSPFRKTSEPMPGKDSALLPHDKPSPIWATHYTFGQIERG